MLGRHADALALLAESPDAEYERGWALDQLGRADEAEREYRAVLAAEPGHRLALRRLAKTLRRSGRLDDLLGLCEALAARGVRHAHLLYVWGTALALAGRDAEARALLLDPARIVETRLPAPAGFADLDAFDAALAEELLANPYRLSEFPIEEEANRGSRRVHALFAGRRPDLIGALVEAIQTAVDAHLPAPEGASDPWVDARPAAARLSAWGLLQTSGDYEEWHLHPGGWMSGVYYVRIPSAVSGQGDGPGCIEFGPPTALARLRPDYLAPRRYVPREGMLLLAPSHYSHRTVPFAADEARISFAFDVVPCP